MGSIDGFDLHNIQGDIWPGLSKRYQQFFFFSIDNPDAFKPVLKTLADEVITSANDAVLNRAKILKVKAPSASLGEAFGSFLALPVTIPMGIASDFFDAIGPAHEIPRAKGSDDVSITGVNMSFTARGMSKLSKEKFKDDPFLKGMYTDMTSGEGRDEDGDWIPEFKNGSIDGVVLVCGTENEVKEKRKELAEKYFNLHNGVRHVLTLDGNERPGKERGHEHFGFLDGISQPFIKGLDDERLKEKGARQQLTSPGVILFGYDGEERKETPPQPAWAKDGSFLVIRKLRQFVPEWNSFLRDEAWKLGFSQDKFGARLMGRWKSGAPVQENPDWDNSAEATRNDFDYPEDDHTNCPFASHMRKTKPRSGMGNTDVFDIMRRGIPYGPETGWDELGSTKKDRGLMFLCYQTSIKLGFQFINNSWINSDEFPPNKTKFTGGKKPGLDVVVGQPVKVAKNDDDKVMQIALVDGFKNDKQVTFKPFVKSNGGDYFFTPSLKLMRDLAVAPAV